MINALILAALGCAMSASLRFGPGPEQPESWAWMREAIETNRGAFDEVWFSTGCTFPALETHEKRAKAIARCAEDLRKIGISPSIEIQTVIGHTDAIASRGDNAGKTWTSTWVGWDGAVAKTIACPRAPELKAYFIRVAAIYAAWQPVTMWFDDDIRYQNRAPSPRGPGASAGCYCEQCLAAFSAREGKTWTRAALAPLVVTDPEIERRWYAFQVDSLTDLVRPIAAEIHRVSPKTVLGYQFGTCYEPVARALHEESGMKIRLRPGGCCYWDLQPHELIDKAYALARAAGTFARWDFVEGWCPEIETCPRTLYCRTPQGLIVESFANLAFGADFLSLFISGSRTDEDPAFYRDTLFRRYAGARPFLDAFKAANRGALPLGYSVPDGRPQPLVATRGLPVVTGLGRTLGELDILKVPANTAGSAWIGGYSDESRVAQVMTGTDWMRHVAELDARAGGKTPILFTKPSMAFVVANALEDGTLKTVALVNASMDRQEPVTVRLRGVPKEAKAAVWHTVEGGDVLLPLRREGADALADLPRLPAWECAYLTFK